MLPHTPRVLRLRSLSRFVAACLFVLALVPLAGVAAPREIRRGVDVLEAWDGSRKLFVKGDIGVRAELLDKLESWISNEAPNWTVVVLENAQGETYRAADGRSYSGMDAVEFSLGQGLPNNTAFGELRDERTGENNGAIFVIFLRERKFWYAGSEVFDNRNLGEDHWVGHLDRPAFRAMSNGGRVIDAVTGTISEIEGQLTRQIGLEQSRRERAAIEAERKRAQAAASVEQAMADVDRLQKAATDFRGAHPAAVGDLANPKLLHWRAQARSAGELLAVGREADALRLASQASEFVRAHSNALARYPEAPPKFDDLNQAIARLNPDLGGWGAAQLSEARDALTRAQAAHARGESVYVEHFRAAESAFYSAHEVIARAKGESERRISAARELASSAKRKADAVRNTALVAGGALGLGTLGLGWTMARRRRPFREEARATLERWKRKFAEQTERLFGLLDRASVVVGSEDELDSRGYTGETERLAREVIRDVDGLFIMSSSVERVLSECALLIEPRYAYQRFYNRFGTGRFRRATALLKQDPISFNPGEGVRPLKREGGEDGKPLGKIDTHEPFALTFEQLVDQFSGRAGEAKDKLNRIETAWAKIDAALEDAQQAIDTAGTGALTLANAASGDGRFPLPSISNALLPASQGDLDAAIEMGRGDPVGAFEVPLPASLRKSSDASALCDLFSLTRAELMPEMAQDVGELEEMGRSGLWVDEFLERYALRGEEIALASSGEEPGDKHIDQLERRLRKLAADAQQAVELAIRAGERSSKEMEAVADAAMAARREFAETLSLPAGELLREEGLDPDVRLRIAREQRDAALLAIDRGGVLAAEAALDEAEALAADALALVGESRRSFAEHAAISARHSEENAHLDGSLPDHDRIVTGLQKDFAPSALLDGAGTASVEVETTVADLLRMATGGLEDARERIERAQQERERGELIAAAASLVDAGDLQNYARRLLEEIREHRERLQAAVADNAALCAQLESQRRGLEPTMDDHRSRRATIDAFEELVRHLALAGRSISAPQPDPFASAVELDELRDSLAKLAMKAENDRKLFEEATRSLGDASGQIAVARRLGHQAAHDKIPDSMRTLELQEEIEMLLLAERAAERRMKNPHDDWAEIDGEVDRLSAGAGRSAAELRGELERAQAAVASLRSAAAAVRDASGWVGDYGVSISGSPGAEVLHRSRENLMRGHYLETQRFAADARRQAKHAIAQARSEVARKRRAAQRAAEEARRRRAAARRRSSSSFGSSGRGSSGFGSSSRSSFSRSGGSRSSFRSSSGGSRSGW